MPAKVTIPLTDVELDDLEQRMLHAQRVQLYWQSLYHRNLVINGILTVLLFIVGGSPAAALWKKWSEDLRAALALVATVGAYAYGVFNRKQLIFGIKKQVAGWSTASGEYKRLWLSIPTKTSAQVRTERDRVEKAISKLDTEGALLCAIDERLNRKCFTRVCVANGLASTLEKE